MTAPKIPQKKEKRERMAKIVRELETVYPEALCALEYPLEAALIYHFAASE